MSQVHGIDTDFRRAFILEPFEGKPMMKPDPTRLRSFGILTSALRIVAGGPLRFPVFEDKTEQVFPRRGEVKLYRRT